MIKFDFVKDAPPGAQLPKRSTTGSAGYDFFSPETYILSPGEKHIFWSGIKAYMPKEYYLQVVIRSSMGIKRSLRLANEVMVVDSDYADNPSNDGNIGICLLNVGLYSQTIKKGDRIAQGVFIRYAITDDDDASGERTGGYGSTGR